MSRLLLGAAAALLLPTAALAQIPATVASGVGTFGDRNRSIGPALAAPIGGPMYRPGSIGIPGYAKPYFYNRTVIGGFSGYYPYMGYSPFTPFGGGFISGGGFGYGSNFGFGYQPYFGIPGPFGYDPPAEPIPALEATGARIELSNEFPATLTLEFPAAAKVWLDGKQIEGDASQEQVLTSPVLKSGQMYTFKVRAEWEAGGKTYEYTREAKLSSGDRSKVLVMSGTEKK